MGWEPSPPTDPLGVRCAESTFDDLLSIQNQYWLYQRNGYRIRSKIRRSNFKLFIIRIPSCKYLGNPSKASKNRRIIQTEDARA